MEEGHPWLQPEGSVPINVKRFILEGEIVENWSVSLSPTLGINEKCKTLYKDEDPLTHYLKILCWEWYQSLMKLDSGFISVVSL